MSHAFDIKMIATVVLTSLIAFAGIACDEFPADDNRSDVVSFPSDQPDADSMTLATADEVMLTLCDLLWDEGFAVKYSGPLGNSPCTRDIRTGRRNPSGTWLIEERRDGPDRVWFSCKIGHTKPVEPAYQFHSGGRPVYLTVETSAKGTNAVSFAELHTLDDVPLTEILSQLEGVSRKRANGRQ